MLPVIGYRSFDGPKCPSPLELSSPKRSPPRNYLTFNVKVLRSFEEPITICQLPSRDILDLKLHSYTVLYVKTTLNAIKTHSQQLQDKPFKKVDLENKSSQIMHRRLWPQVTGSMGHGRFWLTNRSSVHQEILFILWTLTVRHPVHKSPPYVPYARPYQSNLPYYLLKIHVYIILPYLPARSKWSLTFRFTHQHSVCTYSLLHTLSMPHHLRRRHIS